MREEPINSNLDDMYNCFASDIEFPLGTIFSIVCGMLETILIPISMEVVLNDIEEYLEELKDMEDVKVALIAFSLYACYKSNYCRIDTIENQKIYNLDSFISECFKNWNYATNEYLEKIILAYLIPFPKADKIIVDYSYVKDKREYRDDDMTRFLDGKLPEQKQWKKIFEDVPTCKYDYYLVNTMSEFITTLLKVIFDNRKCIKVCEHCYKFFVPLKRSDEKYCFNRKYFGEQDCKMAVRMEQQRNRLALKQSNIDRMERSVRTMLNYRTNKAIPKHQISATQHKEYLLKINEYKEKVANGNCSIEEYEEFLKTFYKKRYK